MYSRTYLLIRGIARSVTMTLIVGLPLLAVFALEGWAQTW